MTTEKKNDSETLPREPRVPREPDGDGPRRKEEPGPESAPEPKREAAPDELPA